MWFRRKKPRPQPVSKQRRPTVQIAYRDLNARAPEGTGGAYAYCWPLELGKKPEIGDRVFVPDGSGSAPGVVVGFGRDGYDGPLKLVHRLATPEEIAEASATP